MSKRIVYVPAAIEEAIDARDWYESHAPSAAARFIEELLSTIEAIAERPRSCSSLRAGFRFATLRTFPYYVVFRERDDDIQIVAVAHGRRRLGYWKKRLDG